MPPKYGRRPPAVKKPPLTHFLCLPLVTEESKSQLERSLAAFKADVTGSQSSDGNDTGKSTKGPELGDETIAETIHPKAIRPVGALHCTLGVMSLKPDELKTATEVLEGLDIASLLGQQAGLAKNVDTGSNLTEGPVSLQQPITPPTADRSAAPLKIDLKGLESMHAPEKTSILYIAPSDASQRLYSFCLALQKVFKDADLLVEDSRDLKLHATIVNTIYAKTNRTKTRHVRGTDQGSSSAGDRAYGHGPNANAPLKIDARDVLARYQDFVWAENVGLDRVAICEMGAKKVLDELGNVISEEYTEVASVALPA